MRGLTASAPFTREELLARGVSAEAADELLLFAARLMDRHSRRHAPPLEDHERNASPHRFNEQRTVSPL